MSEKMEFKISGIVRERESRKPLPGLIVKAYDKDLFFDDVLGAAKTDDSGKFQLWYEGSDYSELFERRPDIYLKILDTTGQYVLYSMEDTVRYDAGGNEYFEIEIPRKKLQQAETGKPQDGNGRSVPALKITVLDYQGQPLSDAAVSLEPLNSQSDETIRAQFDKHRKSFLAEGVGTGAYSIRVEAEDFETQEREVVVQPSGLEETFILGKEGMQFFYRGHVKVPFDPPRDLLAVAVAPRFTEKQEKELLALARELKLSPVEVSEDVRKEGVRVFGFPDETREEEKATTQERLSSHPLVRQVGPVIGFDREGIAFLTNELVVKFKAHVVADDVPDIARRYGLDVLRTIPYAGNAFLMRAATQRGFELLKTNHEIIESGLVEYAEPNLACTMVNDWMPNDTLFDQQGHHQIIRTPEAWDTTHGSKDIIIAIVDDGCDINHPEFADSVSPGVSKVINPFDFMNMDNDVTAPANLAKMDNHGTGCAGIATANADNMQGIAGIAPGCRLMPIKRPGFGDLGYADLFVWVAGFDPGSKTAGFPAPISPGADVISNSFGFGLSTNPIPISGLMKDTFDFLTTYGRSGKGCIVVFSVGNNDVYFTNARVWAAYEKTIAVSNSRIAPPERRTNDSNYGDNLDVCAPGGGPDGGASITTDNVGAGDDPALPDYYYFGGTSAACPQVAGSAALMLSVNPNLTWVEVRQILRDTAVKIDADNADPIGKWVSLDGDDYSQWYGYGRIDVKAALDQVKIGASRDIYVRENLSDMGTLPSSGVFYDSPDIWVRNLSPAMDGAAALPAGYDSLPPALDVKPDQPNWVYVRVRNRGTDASFNFYVRIYLTHFAGTEFLYPTNFIPTTRPSDPIPSPLVFGTYLLGAVSHPSLAAGASTIVNVEWPANLVPPQKVTVNGTPVKWHPCLLVEISPHDGPAAKGPHVWDDNNLAQKNVTIAYPDNMNDNNFAAAIVMGNDSNQSSKLDLIVDRSEVPPQVRLYVELLDRTAMDTLIRCLREDGNGGETGDYSIVTLLEDTRVSVDHPQARNPGQNILTLPAQAKLLMREKEFDSNRSSCNFELGSYKGKDVAWLAAQGEIRIPVSTNGKAIPLIIGGIAGKEIEDGDYEVKLIQEGPNGRASGAVGVRIHIGR